MGRKAVKFGEIDTAEAEGALLAHSLRFEGIILKKGHRIAAEDIEALLAADKTRIIVARLEDCEVEEDAAAARIGAAAAGHGVTARAAFKGRSNIHADGAGLLIVDEIKLNELNALDEGLTVASLPGFTPMKAAQIAASAKIIPFALSGEVLARAEAILAPGGLLTLHPFRPLNIGLIQTRLPGGKPGLMAKTRRLVTWRLEMLGNRIGPDLETPHEEAALADAIGEIMTGESLDILLILGASATVDRRDVVPAAITAAGGEVSRFGMPVDPGNLLVLGKIGDTDVVGLPGCARSPKLNGLDWVLERLLAGLPITDTDFAKMGLGGLLKETPDRPEPREALRGKSKTGEGGQAGAEVGAVLLAAGSSKRMGEHNKLLSDLDGQPLVRRALDSLTGAGITRIAVVLGHEAEKVRAALGPSDALTFVENPDHAEGLSGSLKLGLTALEGVDKAVVMLGDMPEVESPTIIKLLEAVDPGEGVFVAIPSWQGKRGNPVVWHRALFDEIMELSGDQGARGLFEKYAAFTLEVTVEDPGICLDVDTEEALAALLANKNP
ncbi:MAG: molybdopterin-binding/glycosyltransferase family 2 protein [Sphingomonadales bacterium]